MCIEIYQMGDALVYADRQTYGRTHEQTDVFLQCFEKAPTTETFSQQDLCLD